MTMKKRDIIFPVGTYLGVPYFKPPVGFDEETCLIKLAERTALNREELRRLPEEKRYPEEHISASFIYAHPPDYYGIPMLHASADDWSKTFRQLKSMRIDTVIFQAALWRGLNECFYRSRRFKDMTCFGVLENMFAAAELENMHVFLGGYGSDAGWKEHLTREEMAEELECHRSCFEELYSLGKFDGMYFPSETAFSGRRLPEKELRMRGLYRNFADMVKNKDSKLKIIVSPATMHDPAENEMFKDFWSAVLETTGIDILMPQDCIGNSCSRLAWMDTQWKAWKEVAGWQNIQLWSNTELFERRGYRPENNFYPASPERVAAQLDLTAPYVSRHCCWEAMYFTSDATGEEGKRLQQFMISGKF